MRADRDCSRFSGLMTTPSGSGGVIRRVMNASVDASQEQIEHVAGVMGQPSNRSVGRAGRGPVTLTRRTARGIIAATRTPQMPAEGPGPAAPCSVIFSATC